MYQCDVCNKNFRIHCNLVVHYRMHTGERPFTCNVCEKQFRQKGHLTDHVKLHGTERAYMCKICGLDFKQSSGLRNHRARCHQTEGSLQTARGRQTARDHQRARGHQTAAEPKKARGRPRKPKSETIQNKAEFNFVTIGKVSGQQTVEIDVENLHKCSICDETFPTVTKLENHIAWHSRRKRYKCMVCSRIFKHPSIFKKHRKLHDKHHKLHDKHQKLHDKRQKLHDKRSKEGSNNQKQDPNMINTEMQVPMTMKEVQDKIGEPFCEKCQKTFSSFFSLTRHINEHHRGIKRIKERKQMRNNLKRYNCRTCRKKFANIYSLRVHSQRAHPLKKHKCHICSKSYGMINDLKRHYKSHHRLHLPYSCDVCGMSFQYQSKLKEHVILHTEQEQSEVKDCVADSKQPSHCKNSEGPHVCDVCGKCFHYPSRLREHYFIHTNEFPNTPTSEWPYQCNVCQKVFRYPSRLKAHYKCHAKDLPGNSSSWLNSLAQYPCNGCEKTFQFESHLRRHQAIHYNQQQPSSSRPSPKGPIHKKHETLNSSPYSKISYQAKQKEGCPTTSTPHSERPSHQQKQEPTVITPNSEACYKCDVCGNTFAQMVYLTRHYVVHSQEASNKPYPCSYCGRSFFKTNHLKKHCEIQHNTNKPFRCERCLLAFCKKVQYRDHLETCTGTLTEKENSKNEIPAERELQRAKRPIGRPKRKKKVSVQNGTANEGDLQQFEWHPGMSPKKKRKTSTGNGMSKYEPHAAEYTIHTSSHGTQTTREDSVDRSDKKQYTLTTKERTPTCNICGATFCSNGSLRMHLDIHLDRRPYSCRFCEMKFRQVGHLTSHCKSVHHEEFPYQCDLCDMPFKGLIALRKHQEIDHNLTQNPNKLDGFEKSATPRYSNIYFEPKQYTRIMNSEQTEYACSFCDSYARTFKSLSGLRRHITIVHNRSVNHSISGENGHPQRTWNPGGIGMVAIPRDDSPVKLSSSEEIYKCNVCSVIVHGWEALEAHEKAHAKKSVNSPSSTSPTLNAFSPPNIKQTFECKFCGEEFDSMSREAFDEHQLEHELAAEQPMGMAYICCECDEEFAMAADLIQHHEECH